MLSSLNPPFPSVLLLRLIATLLLCGTGAAQQAPVPARSVPLLLPSAIAYDPAGNLYIAEARGHAVRRVDTSASIARFAGDGSQGFSGDGGPALAAQLDSPQGLAIDSAGNVYVSDSANNRIRRIDAVTGTIRTVAGTGTPGFSGDSGPALGASLNLPRAICLDPSGNQLYIADSRNHRIRHVDLQTQLIETYAGNGVEGLSGDGAIATSAALDTPEAIVLDRDGDLIIADTQNARIRRVTASTRIIETIAGGISSARTVAAAAALPITLPRGLSTDAKGNLFVADAGHHRVLQIDPATGTIVVVAGGGTQGFAGDGSAAATAALDSPRALALSPDNLVTIADASNQRVRQLLAGPAATTPIQTIAGLGVTVPGVFTLSAPSVVSYGSGSLAATLQAGDLASGQVTFFETGGSANLLLASTPLTSNQAVLSLSSLPAGAHRIMATYTGDTTHGAAQTPVAAINVSPLPVQVTPSPVSILYGSALPALGGSVAGLLPRDAGGVIASFTTSANAASSAGTYPISASLAGPAALNYSLQVSPATLTIAQAPTVTALTNLISDGSFTGALQVQVKSSTSGVPSGSILLLDGSAVLQKSPLSAAGISTLSAPGLASGTHLLTASYSGDQNFLPSASSATTATITPAASPDFSIQVATPTSQVLTAGGSILYTISVQMTGSGLSSPVSLAASGLPAFTSASFSPAYIPPGVTGTTTTLLTITSNATVAKRHAEATGKWPSYALVLPLPLLAWLFRRRSSSASAGMTALLSAPILLIALTTITGCGDRINTSAQATGSLQSYTVAVSGTATGSTGATLQHSTSLTLQIRSSQ